METQGGKNSELLQQLQDRDEASVLLWLVGFPVCTGYKIILTCKYICVYLYISICTYTFMCMYIHISIHIYTHVYVCAHIYLCAYVYVAIAYKSCLLTCIYLCMRPLHEPHVRPLYTANTSRNGIFASSFGDETE